MGEDLFDFFHRDGRLHHLLAGPGVFDRTGGAQRVIIIGFRCAAFFGIGVLIAVIVRALLAVRLFSAVIGRRLAAFIFSIRFVLDFFFIDGRRFFFFVDFRFGVHGNPFLGGCLFERKPHARARPAGRAVPAAIRHPCGVIRCTRHRWSGRSVSDGKAACPSLLRQTVI